MGVGRFVYTPILPLMHTGAGLSAGAGANLATADYIGYLLGALVGILAPALVRSRALLRISLVVLTGTLAAMPATHDTAVWFALRLLAGVASALIFVIAVSSLLSHLREYPAHLPGWAFGGVGAGIALSGLLVLVLRPVADWRAAWWSSAALAAVLAVASWNLRPKRVPRQRRPRRPSRRSRPMRPPRSMPPRTPAARRARTAGSPPCSLPTRWKASATSSQLPGRRDRAELPGPLGGGAWVLVGLAAVPSSALWAQLRAPLVPPRPAARRARRPGGGYRPAPR